MFKIFMNFCISSGEAKVAWGMLKYFYKNSMWFDSSCKLYIFNGFAGLLCLQELLVAGWAVGWVGRASSAQCSWLVGPCHGTARLIYLLNTDRLGRQTLTRHDASFWSLHLLSSSGDPCRLFYEFLTRTVWLSSPAIGYRCTNPKYWQKKVSVVLQRPLLAVIPGEIGHCRKTREGEEAKNPPNKI